MDDSNDRQALKTRWEARYEGCPVFLLAPFDRYSSIRSQQQRALNLAAYIEVQSSMKSVAIVGAGAGGATLAVALARKGIGSVLFDPDPPLSRFRKAHHRWVHPHIIEWPVSLDLVKHLGEVGCTSAEYEDRLWFKRSTSFPLMNWSAGPASAVARSLHRSFQAESEKSGELIRLVQSRVLGLVPQDHKLGVSLSNNERTQYGFDAVVQSTGFGVEEMEPNYWQPDYLDSVRESDNVTIVGSGDGALADLLRTLVRGFSYDRVLRHIEGLAPSTTEFLIKLEQDAAARPSEKEASEFLAEQYKHLGQHRNSELGEFFSSRRTQASVEVQVKAKEGETVYRRAASPVQRYLVAHLDSTDFTVDAGNARRKRTGPNHGGLTAKNQFHVWRAGATQQDFADAELIAERRKLEKASNKVFAGADYQPGFIDRLRWPCYDPQFFGPREDDEIRHRLLSARSTRAKPSRRSS